MSMDDYITVMRMFPALDLDVCLEKNRLALLRHWLMVHEVGEARRGEKHSGEHSSAGFSTRSLP